jgi:hypothetical protein
MSFNSIFNGGRKMKTALFTKPLTIALNPAIFDRIKRITDNEQISMAEWVRDAVDAALNNIKREEGKMDE